MSQSDPTPDPKAIARGLSEAQRRYIIEGPHPHWTQTRYALARRMLVKGDGTLGSLGLQVRALLLEGTPNE